MKLYLIIMGLATLLAILVTAAGTMAQPRMEVDWHRAQNCLYAPDLETGEGTGAARNMCPRTNVDSGNRYEQQDI